VVTVSSSNVVEGRTWTAALLLFGSGFCALVYQIGWLREFRLIFGASTAASAAVLAIFIGGLGAGSLLLGPRADRQARPLLFYSNLEATIAVCAALSPFLLALVRIVYIGSGGSARLGMPIATIGRLALSALVLAVPTLAMGGTLPAAARFVTPPGDTRRQEVAVLYASNTLGAVAGCFASTFWMLEIFGTRRTLWLAAAINLLVAVIARQVDRGWSGGAGRAEEAGWETAAHPAHPAPPAQPDLPELPVFVLVASATVGFAFFLLELIWYRLLAPLLGGSVFTFGLILAVALAGIGIGGFLYAMVAADRRVSIAGFAASCLLEAVAVAGTYALGDRLGLLALALLPVRAGGFLASVGGWTIVTAIVVLPSALVAGYQFPQLIALCGSGRERVGSHVGLAYAANTFGAIVGSLAGGFGLLPWLSAPTAWRLVALVLVLLGLAAIAMSVARRERRPSAAVPYLALAAVGLVLVLAPGPSAFSRHSGIGAGRTSAGVLSAPNAFRGWAMTMKRSVVWDADGVESAVALVREESGYFFVVNGKSDGSARGDAGTQVMSGLIAALRVPEARRSLVIGLGTGSTAGWLGAIPTMERVDVVELEPVVLNVARACTPVNHDALANPKVHVTIGDAREALLTGRDRYDVIVSEPSNPFRAGIASLFTHEYYRAVAERLTPNGVFAQWIQGYEIDAATLQTVYRTLDVLFPHVETWQTNGGDLLLVASMRPAAYGARALAARLQEEPFRSAMAHAWRAVDLNGLFAHYIGNDRLGRALAAARGVELNSDDRNVIEFGLGRSVGRGASDLLPELRRGARSSGALAPPIDDQQALSWPAIDTAWANFNGWRPAVTAGLGPASAAEVARRAALQRYYESGDTAGARDLWRRQTDGPRDLDELALAADVEADAGSPAAAPLIDRLRAYQPGEADTILSVLRFRERNGGAAIAAIESALARFQIDPWPLVAFKQKALALATAFAAEQPGAGRRLYDALARPFALDALREERLSSALTIASRFDFAALCRGPVASFEPNVIWTERFLQQRRECYRLTNDPRLDRATRDLQDFLAREPQRLSIGQR
jgi:spermidine synthase